MFVNDDGIWKLAAFEKSVKVCQRVYFLELFDFSMFANAFFFVVRSEFLTYEFRNCNVSLYFRRVMNLEIVMSIFILIESVRFPSLIFILTI